MSLAILKKAIKEQDWDGVVEAYENMSGEQLQRDVSVEEKPKKKRGRPPKNKPTEVVDDGPIILGKPKTNGKVRPNLFVDNLTEEKDQLQKGKKPPARKDSGRPKFEKIEVLCSSCGKVKQESPLIVSLCQQGTGKYTCNRCQAKGFGR